MSNPQILQDILGIDVNNEFLKYIVERVQQKNYRGKHISQHNRYDLDKLLKILEVIRNVTGYDRFKLHPSDDKGVRYPECAQYYEIVDGVKRAIGTETVNTLKKNLFVDFGRMGFLDRFDRKGNLIVDGQPPVDVVKIGELGKQLLESEALTEQYDLFIKGLAKLLKDYPTNLAEIIYRSNFKNDKIDIYEFMFILSDDRNEISDRKIDLLTSYKKLSRDENTKLKNLLKEYCEPKNFAGNRTEQKDFGNWKNECQQIFKLLNCTVYFVATNEHLSLSPKITEIFKP